MDSRWYRTDIPREEVLYSLRSMMMQIAICIRSPFTVSIRVLYLRKDIQISQENTKSFSSREGTRFRLNPASADLLYNDRLGTDNNKAADL